MPFTEKSDKSTNLQDFYIEPEVISRNLNISKVAAGFSHSIMLS